MDDRLTATMASDNKMMEYTATVKQLKDALESKDMVKAKIFKKALTNFLKQQYGI